jgi:signal peptidase II
MFLLIAALLVALDQATKLWAQSTFPLGGEGLYVGLGFYLTYVRNTGAAFGILQNGTLLLGILSAVVSVLIALYLWRKAARMGAVQRAALTLILAGALGNMVDRFRLGYVIDFIHFQVPGFSFPVFNVADSCVVIGAGLLLLSSFLEGRSRPVDTEESGARLGRGGES